MIPHPGEESLATIGDQYRAKLWRGSSHEITRRHVESLAAGSRILDIGTAAGFLGKALPRSRYHLTGIEPDPDRADAASEHYDQVFVGTLAEVPDEFIRGFDLVVCCDVFEHMTDPERQLARLVKAQSPNASFLVSVPNVAHLWVRLNLLVGRFDYADRGILDRTHLRFFTRKGLVRMLEDAGLVTSWIRPTPVPLELIHPFFLETAPGRTVYHLQQLLVTAMPRFFGYQFVAFARPRGHQDG